MKDQRIRLLEKLNEQGLSTSEFVANEYLLDFKGDLGTIRRMLIELIDFDLIRESNVEKENKEKSIIRNIETEWDEIDSLSPNKADKKSILRLVEPVGIHEKINQIRIYITIKGIQFLTENEKLNVDFIISKWNKKWFWPVAVIAVLGLVLSLLTVLNIL